MNIIEKPNDLPDTWRCHICGKDNKKKQPIVLIGIDGTQVGNNIKAAIYHVECIELTEYNSGDKKTIAMVVNKN